MARGNATNFNNEIKSSIADARAGKKQPPTPTTTPAQRRGSAQLKEGTAAEEASETPAIEAQEMRTGRDPRTGQPALDTPAQMQRGVMPMLGGGGLRGGGDPAANAHAASIAHAILARGG